MSPCCVYMVHKIITDYTNKIINDPTWQTQGEEIRRAKLGLAEQMLATADLHNLDVEKMYQVVLEMLRVA